MDVSDVLRRLLRRRFAVLAVVVVALVVAAVGWKTAGSSQQSVAAVVLVPPTEGTDNVGQNPLLNLDNNLSQLATVLASALESPTVTDALDAMGATSSFTISTETGTNPSFAQLSPQLTFTVSGPDAAVTEKTATALVAQSRVQLGVLQERAGVPAVARAAVVEVVAPTAALTVGSGRLRSAGALGLAVLVLGLLAVLIADEVGARRARRRPPRRHRRATAGPGPTGSTFR